MSNRRLIFLAASVALMFTLLGAGVFAQAVQKDNVYRYLSVFSEVFSIVTNNYVEDVPSEKLLEGAFDGVTSAIDEFSYYIPPSELATYKKYVPQESDGIGIAASKRFGYGYVIAPVIGSPADKAGVTAGDFIETIDGAPTQKMALWQIEQSLRSPKPVKLQILRGSMSKRESITVTPAPSPVPSINVENHGDVAYVKVPTFTTGTRQLVSDALSEVRKSGAKKLIMDVRSNAVGSIEEAIAVADLFLSSGAITSLNGRRIEKKSWTADRATAFDGEVLVLADHSSAMGAEVFAAALSGNKRARVVGVSSYGKAITQKFVTLPSGGGLYVTIGRYSYPDGKLIQEQGVKPDVNVDLSSLAVRENGAAEPQKKDDLILEKALTLFGANARQKTAA